MKTLAGVVRRLSLPGERARGLRQLEATAHPAAAVVSAAIRSARASTFDADERRWADRIERLRDELAASKRTIIRIDYGAGDPGSRRSEDQMRVGVEVTETLGAICHTASKLPLWCRVLFALIRGFKPVSCVEMGTAVGISAAYQAAALALNGSGRLVTLEGAASLAEVARSTFGEVGLDNVDVVVGRFDETLGRALAERAPVDYVFVDGHHDGDATVAYFESLFDHLAPRAILVFDDISWSGGMRRAWWQIAADDRVGLVVDMGPVGLCVVDPGHARVAPVRIPLQ